MSQRIKTLNNKKVVTEGVEPSTVALLAQRSNQLSYATSLLTSISLS